MVSIEEKKNIRQKLKGLNRRELRKIIYSFYFPIKDNNSKNYIQEQIKNLIRLTNRVNYRKNILERDNFKCRLCGETERDILEVHHLTERNMGGDNSILNLITVCSPCHMFLHCNPKVVMKNRRLATINKNKSTGRPLGSKDKLKRSNEGYKARWGSLPELNNLPPKENYFIVDNKTPIL